MSKQIQGLGILGSGFGTRNSGRGISGFLTRRFQTTAEPKKKQLQTYPALGELSVSYILCWTPSVVSGPGLSRAVLIPSKRRL